MRSISFNRLHAVDFKVYHDFTFDFTRFGPGCHSIRGVNKVTPRLGSNGAGKSTLWDALCFALFGKTAKRLRSQDVVPYGSDKNPSVTLDFTVDGRPYRIIRRAWPHSLVLHTGAKTEDEALRSSPQERIEQLLGMDLDLFLHTIVLAQGQPLFLDLAPRDKLALLSTVLNLDRFEAYAQKAKEGVSRVAVEDHTLKIMRSTVEGQLAEVERQIDDLKLKALAFAANRERAIRLQLTQFRDAEAALGALETKVLAAKADRDAAEHEERSAYQTLAQAQAQFNQGKQLRIRVGRMTVGSDCPQCGQPVTKQAHSHLAEQAELLIDTSNYEQLSTSYERLRADASTVRADHERIMREERAAVGAVEAARVGLDAARAQVDPFTEPGSIAAQRRHHLEERAREIDNRRDQLEQERQTIEPWVEGFKNIRLMVLDDVLATLSVLTTSYANELGLPCTVAFAIERTTKAGTVVSGVQMTVDAIERLEAWSGGEAPSDCA